MNVLIIMCYPRKTSFSGAIAEAYKERAYKERVMSVGLKVRQLNLIDYDFNPNIVMVSPRNQEPEEIVSEAQQDILWADHLVLPGGDQCPPC